MFNPIGKHAKLGVGGTNLFPFRTIHHAALLGSGTTTNPFGTTSGSIDRQILFQAAGGHGDFFDDLIAQSNRRVNTDIKYATDFPSNNDGNGNNRMQPFVLDVGIQLMRDHIGTGVVRDTNRSPSG